MRRIDEYDDEAFDDEEAIEAPDLGIDIDDIYGEMREVNPLEEDGEVREEEEKAPTLQEALEALQQTDRVPDERLLTTLSDLNDSGFSQVLPVWRGLDASYRRMLMQMLADMASEDYRLDFSALGHMALNDADGEVRRWAVEVLSEETHLSLMNKFMQMAERDRDLNVRAEAVRSLGRFILAGELGDLPEAETLKAQNVAVTLYHNTALPSALRGAALEAIGNCTRDDLIGMIQDAYRHGDAQLRLSAVVAMGKSSDDVWAQIILDELESEDDSMCREAVRAAGEIQLRQAVPHLVPLLKEGERDLREVVVWALGEIGGKQAVRALQMAADVATKERDDDLMELIEDAIGNASMVDGRFFHD